MDKAFGGARAVRGSLQRSTDPLAGLRGLLRAREGTKGEGREKMDYPSTTNFWIRYWLTVHVSRIILFSSKRSSCHRVTT